MRVGYGIDAHRFAGDGDPRKPLVLLGVTISETRSLEGTSDADVATHAVADALLGSVALGDIGMHFPSSDPQWRGVDSMELLATVVSMVRNAGYSFGNVDVTVIAESVRIAPHRELMRARLAQTLGISIEAVSVKATSTDGMGFTGRDEGIAAMAVATCFDSERSTG
jgi:2-C-methyl-D-erythritol 4-phosphate cytidylyltransferase/2-C-methyl-D-erythritol 2,4-cyclodiphosphate synthase